MNLLKTKEAVSGRLGESVKRETGSGEGPMEVVKSIRLPTSSLSATWDDRLLSRIQHLCDGNSLGILKLESITRTEDKIQLVSEFQEMNGDEFMEQKAPLSPDLCISWALEFIDALFFMHMNGFIHGNIKPSNFFWSEEMNRLSVADFAYAKVPVKVGEDVGSLETEDSSEGSETKKRDEWAPLFDFAVTDGPVKYSAPESGMGLISEKMDVFSFGCLLFEALSGEDYKKCYIQADESTDEDTAACGLDLSRIPSEFRTLVSKCTIPIWDERWSLELVQKELRRLESVPPVQPTVSRDGDGDGVVVVGSSGVGGDDGDDGTKENGETSQPSALEYQSYQPDELAAYVEKWMTKPKGSIQLVPIYRATPEASSTQKWASAVEGQRNTLTVIELEDGSVFGGFMSVCPTMEDTGDEFFEGHQFIVGVRDEEAFLFRLKRSCKEDGGDGKGMGKIEDPTEEASDGTNSDVRVFRVKPGKEDDAVQHHCLVSRSTCGWSLQFGKEGDLEVNFDHLDRSVSFVGGTYEGRRGLDMLTDCENPWIIRHVTIFRVLSD
eukprot:TRINITY_DN4369_c0_g1_i1.p1 TRINITY_DN4369_c0_g1~~TRINITY_DN4369_c0_g1_i1.p1  ORF type:complete len:551 (-),score=178.18 TRINITY_DN4369_c0_g1_i1:32-1684(-)